MKPAMTTGASMLALAMTAPLLAAPQDMDNNQSAVVQAGTDGRATVVQTGSENESKIEQDSQPALNPTNQSNTPPVGNVATVTQEGLKGYSSITQTGDNTASVNQSAASASMNSVIEQSYTGNNNNQTNQATVIQRGTGAGKDANPESTGFTGSSISQTGVNGYAYVVQDEGTLDAVSRITQTGDNSRAKDAEVFQINGTPDSEIIQGGDRGQKAEVYQDGSHTSRIEQTFRNSTAGVRQEGGEGNFSDILQEGWFGNVGNPAINGNPIGTGDARIGVWQIGNDNRSEIDQDGRRITADVFQNGDENESYIDQNSPDRINAANNQFDNNLQAFVEQVGFSNLSRIDQDDEANSFGNTANVRQLGDEGESTVTQAGNTNTANLLQGLESEFNISAITQGGSGNMANVNQYSDDNTSSVIQNGTAGMITVNQGAP
ncbi:Curlin-associated protein [Erythrobacter dokdonensis DSW-74]|uniref:Curlin-associated protein n=2 Tax=Erythrobacter TaxID=1041 RepID=A0A1A7BCG0_9SPHN|nr:Curlin-associated protein [Erythrobacter dokdonensis DSW-74]